MAKSYCRHAAQQPNCHYAQSTSALPTRQPTTLSTKLSFALHTSSVCPYPGQSIHDTAFQSDKQDFENIAKTTIPSSTTYSPPPTIPPPSPADAPSFHPDPKRQQRSRFRQRRPTVPGRAGTPGVDANSGNDLCSRPPGKTEGRGEARRPAGRVGREAATAGRQQPAGRRASERASGVFLCAYIGRWERARHHGGGGDDGEGNDGGGGG